MKRSFCIFLALMLLFIGFSACQEVKSDCHVAVSANLQFAMDDLVADFEGRSGFKIAFSTASSGQLYAQIKNGAPFALFLSADTLYPTRLFAEGMGLEPPVIYARGKLILWTKKQLDIGQGLSVLRDPKITRIAIGNPETAPYGMAAKEALQNTGLWTLLEKKLIFGQSISQVNHYIHSQAADIGITAKSAIYDNDELNKDEFIEIDTSLYSPIQQAMIRLKNAQKPTNTAAKEFYAYMQTNPAKAILKKHGFEI